MKETIEWMELDVTHPPFDQEVLMCDGSNNVEVGKLSAVTGKGPIFHTIGDEAEFTDVTHWAERPRGANKLKRVRP